MTTWQHGRTLPALGLAYADGLTPFEVVSDILRRLGERASNHAVIQVESEERSLKATDALGPRPAGRPLWRTTFELKGCNDIPGMPTTNTVPDMAATPRSTGPALSRLLAAGAIPIGKTDIAQTDIAQTDMAQTDMAQTDMAQTGIGLVGMRWPCGAPSSASCDEHISGGGCDKTIETSPVVALRTTALSRPFAPTGCPRVSRFLHSSSPKAGQHALALRFTGRLAGRSAHGDRHPGPS